jgi:hypothetical protein
MKFYGDYQVYSESGVDLTLLKENMQRPFETRWAINLGFLRFAAACRESARAKESTGHSSKEGPQMVEFDPSAFLRLLTDQQVEFVVIGGLAMMAQGSAYFTKDLDVCYAHSPRNLALMAKTIGSLHPYLRGVPPGLPFHWDVPTIQAGLNFTLTTDLGAIDLLGEVAGLGDYDKVLAQSEPKVIFGMTIRVLSVDGLIAAKKAAGRTKDRLHLLELEELKKLRDTQP